MLLYIDTDTGTWGVAEQNLVIFKEETGDVDYLMDALTDQQINDLGLARKAEQNGQPQ